MARDTAPSSYAFDIDPRSCHLTPKISPSSEASASAFFLAQLLAIVCESATFPLQQPHPWNIIYTSGEWKWTLVNGNRRALASSRVKTSTR